MARPKPPASDSMRPSNRRGVGAGSPWAPAAFPLASDGIKVRGSRRVLSAGYAEGTTQWWERDRTFNSRTRGRLRQAPDSKGKRRSWAQTFSHPATRAVRKSVLDALLWVADVFRLAVAFAKKPLGYLLALYLVFAACMLFMHALTDSVHSVFDSLCSVPGISWTNPACSASSSNSPMCQLYGFRTLAPSWCPVAAPTPSNGSDALVPQVEELARVHGMAGKVIEASIDMAALPLEMQRSDSVIKDLRVIARSKELKHRDRLVKILDDYLDVSDKIIESLIGFNVGCDSLVTRFLTLNQWTLEQLRDLNEFQTAIRRSWFSPLLSLLAPPPLLSEQELVAHYTKHISRAAQLVESHYEEAMSILRLLKKGGKLLDDMNDFAFQEKESIEQEQLSSLQLLWIQLTTGNKLPQDQAKRIYLLGQVNTQREKSIRILETLTRELLSIKAGLLVLREQVADGPELNVLPTDLPLRAHIDIISACVARLEATKIQSLAEKEDREKEARDRLYGPPRLLIEAK